MAVTTERTLRNTLTSTFYLVEIVAMTSLIVIKWHLASIGYPACMRDRLLLETQLLLEVLQNMNYLEGITAEICIKQC